MKRTGSIVLRYGDRVPRIPESVFLAPGSVIVGDVTLGEWCSVWFNAVVRGDVHSIRIGAGTNIQDLAMLHVTHDAHPLTVGDNVTVGHHVTLHGCVIGDGSLIGIGATVLDGAVVEPGAIVAAGALVTPGTVVPSGTVFAGVPGNVLRRQRSEETADLVASARRYVEYAARMSRSMELPGNR